MLELMRGLSFTLGLVACPLLVAAAAIGCTDLIGSFEVQTAPLLEGGASEPVIAGEELPEITRPCEDRTDCPALETTPPGCSFAQCVDKKCVYEGIDADGDGHGTATCKAVDGTPVKGDDCADDAPTIFPGGACSKLPDGRDITFPNGTPLGACKAGTWECAEGAPVCKGAVAPAPAENCALKNDANCDGVPDDGCDCEPGTTSACGNVAGLPLPCKAGTRTCSPEGKWQPCSGNVEPKARNCGGVVDNDCNGQPDRNEAACNCAGGVAQGKGTKCTVGGALGVCANGARICQPSEDGQTGVFGPCTGPEPGRRDCASPLDQDCNGLSDELEVACGSPCVGATGALVAATQKFPNGMWGCGGKRAFGQRDDACGMVGVTRHTACGVGRWVEHIRSGGKLPTRQYWVAERLNYGFTGSILPPPAGSCWAATSAQYQCSSSMAVCIGSGGPSTDQDGNTCNWSGCTAVNGSGPNDHLGGCINTDTAGTLCCPAGIIFNPGF